MDCRPGCAACCIAPSISSPIPGMPAGKPAGVRCAQLDEQDRCRIFGRPERPAVCGQLRPHPEMCRGSAAEALEGLALLEIATAPRPPTGLAFPGLRPLLVAILRDPDARVRERAVAALAGHEGDPEVRAALGGARDGDPDRGVRAAAAQVVGVR